MIQSCFNSFKVYLLVFIATVLVACGDEDNTEPPADLVDFERSASIQWLWSTKASNGIKQQFLFLQPLLLEDKIVTASRDGLVSVIDLQDGSIIEEIELDRTLSGGVGGNEDVWLLSTREGELIAIDGRKHEVVWIENIPSETLARPVVHGDHAFIRTVDGQVISLDTSTGEIRWAYQQSKPALTLRGSSSPVVARNKIFVGLANGRLVALSPDDGAVIWDVALAVPKGHSEIQRLVDIDGHAVLFGHVLYVGSFQGRVAAIDVQKGQFLWARDFSTYSGVTLDSKVLYSADDRSHIWALDRYNGATLWKQEKLQARSVTRPMLVGDYIVVGDYDGYLHVMSQTDGHFVARIAVGGHDEDNVGENGILVPPVIDGENILVKTRNGMLHAYTIKELIPDS
jgi:outer membrane protein assembly factor BamB